MSPFCWLWLALVCFDICVHAFGSIWLLRLLCKCFGRVQLGSHICRRFSIGCVLKLHHLENVFLEQVRWQVIYTCTVSPLLWNGKTLGHSWVWASLLCRWSWKETWLHRVSIITANLKLVLCWIEHRDDFRHNFALVWILGQRIYGFLMRMKCDSLKKLLNGVSQLFLVHLLQFSSNGIHASKLRDPRSNWWLHDARFSSLNRHPLVSDGFQNLSCDVVAVGFNMLITKAIQLEFADC